MNNGARLLLYAWPAVRWLLALAAGIAAARFGWDLPAIPVLAAGLIATIAALLLRSRPFWQPLGLAGTVLIALAAGYLRADAVQRSRVLPMKLEAFSGDTVRMAGTMRDLRRNARGQTVARLDADSLLLGGRWIPLRTGLLATWIQEPAFRHDTAAHVNAILQTLPPDRHDGRFNYRAWLLDQNITLRARILSLEPGSGASPGWMASVRNSLFRRIDAVFDPDIRGLMKALLIGYTHEVSDELKDRFSDSGLSHIMAVSGLHVIYVMAPVLLVFSWIGRAGFRRHLLFGLTLGILFFYAWLTGLSPSVLRASFMMVLFTFSRLYEFRTSAANVLAASAVIILLWRPFDLFHTGFQLSYAAVVLLLLFARPVSEALPERHRETWYGKVALVAPVSFVIQLGLWPVLAWYFERVSIISPLANIPAVYLSEFAVMAGGAALFVDALLPQLAFIPAWLASWCARGVAFSAEFFGALPWATVESSIRHATFFLPWIAMTGLAARWFEPALRMRWLLLSLAGWALHTGFAAWHDDPPRHLQVVFFDVGQGDAALVRTPSGKNLLIDTGGLRGPVTAASYAILPWLERHRIDTLHAVVITHDHLDHSAGLNPIAARIPILTVYLPPDPRNDAFSNALRTVRDRALASRGARIVTLAAGDRLPLDPAVFAGVIAPLPSFLAEKDKNMTSIGLVLQHGATRWLFTGDLPAEGEEPVAEAFGSLLDADIIKTAHHGSRYSSAPAWLSAATPRIAITSSALENRYGHPHAETIQRLSQAGARLYHTALHGTITITDPGHPDRVTVVTQRSP